MPKKYIQLLLSINFCLTAVATATGSDAGSDDSFVMVPNPEITKAADTYWADEEHNWEMDGYPDLLPQDQASSFESPVEFRDQFCHIWQRLEKINEIYSSELLQEAILQHQENLENPTSYNESNPQQDLTQNILVQFSDFYIDLEALSKYQLEEELDEDAQALLNGQFAEICKCVDRIYNLYKKKALSKNDQFFLYHQLKELLDFSQSFLAQDSSSLHNATPVNELSNGTLHFVKRATRATDLIDEFSSTLISDEFSSTEIELKDQFNQIWDRLDEINAIHRSETFQRLISHHRDAKMSYNESLEEVSRETLENQLSQLNKVLEACYQYQSKEKLDEGSRAKLGIRFGQIKRCLSTIHEIYESKKESLSKKEKAFLRDQSEELNNFSHDLITLAPLQSEKESLSRREKAFLKGPLEDFNNFSYNLITPPPLQTDEVGLNSSDRIQTSLDSCKEEDSLIYPQYEYIINGQEANISELLTSSKTQSAIENQFLYFNQDEKLIEIRHIESPEDEEHVIYTTTWRIRPADVDLVKDWEERDPITIDKTPIYSKYTMRGEKLDYTLTNQKRSVRANFVCKSSNRNIYTIQSIDYFENIVVLKNGGCLFVVEGDLGKWHAGDIVILQTDGPVTDTNNTHRLFNKTRGHEEVWILLKKKF